MTTTITIKRFDYLFLKNDYFNKSKDSRLRNDIIYVEYKDGTKEARIYLNNKEEYVVIPYDNIMLNQISKITWTKDGSNGKFIKSDADDKNLNNILKKYNDNYYYIVKCLEDDVISEKEKSNKRKQFIKNNPYSNTENPDGYER